MKSWQRPPRIKGRQLTFGLASQRILQLRSDLPGRKELLSRPQDGTTPLDAFGFFQEIRERGMEICTDLHVAHCIQKSIKPKHTPFIHHINVSAVTLVNPRFREFVHYQMEETDWQCEQICWEITEMETAPDLQGIVKTSEWLLEQGFHVALDDYEPGNPYEPLLQYPLPWLVKLDQSLQNQPVTMARVIDMLHQKTLPVVAEGVETLQQMEFCIQHEVEYLQGYYIEKPQQLTPTPPVNQDSLTNPEPDGVKP